MQDDDGAGNGRNPVQQQLVDDFLEKWEGYPADAVGRKVEGITGSDVRRWRNDDWEWLTGAKMDALSEHLGRAPTDRMEPGEAPNRD